MQEIRILFDKDSKTINKVEQVGEVTPLDAAKVCINVALSALNKLEVKEKKIKVIKPNIVGGNNGG